MSLRFESQPLPKFRYSPAVRMGPFIKTAGLVGLSADTQALVDGGAGAEFRQILVNLDGLIADNGLKRSEIASATLYVTAFHRFQEINDAWDNYFAGHDTYPARTSVGVAQLPVGAQVEAEFMFYSPLTDRMDG